MSNRRKRSIHSSDLSINPFSIAAKISKDISDNDGTSSAVQVKSDNSRKLKVPRLAKGSLAWDPNWPRTYPWVYRGEGDDASKYVFCRWCKEAGKNNSFTNGCEYFKKQALDRHVNTKDHKMVAAVRARSQTSLSTSFAIQAGTDQLKVMRNMRNMYFLIQHNVSTNTFENLCKLIEIQHNEKSGEFECGTHILNTSENVLPECDDDRAPYASYQNNVTARQFIESIGRVVEEEVLKELRSSGGWGIMIDESDTVSTEKTLAIISKHSREPGKPVYRFLGLISLTDSSANAIMAEIDRFVLAKNISYNDLNHVCTDGATTMTGNIYCSHCLEALLN